MRKDYIIKKMAFSEESRESARIADPKMLAFFEWGVIIELLLDIRQLLQELTEETK